LARTGAVPGHTETDRVEPISGTEPKLSPQEEADKKARELKITGGARA
jgi:hypothetical protein